MTKEHVQETGGQENIKANNIISLSIIIKRFHFASALPWTKSGDVMG